MPNPNKVIVLAADERYSEKVITTIKSICAHNRDITFCLFNRDFSPEWFEHLNGFLAQMDCYIFDAKISDETLKACKTYTHISSDATFFRYFISEMIDVDVAPKVLYLDCDLVVSGPLDVLFEYDLGDHFVAACADNLALHHYNNADFNAGVMLFNIPLCKKERITQKALQITRDYHEILPDGDQTVLNILFKDRWLPLPNGFNYLVGAEMYFTKAGHEHLIDRTDDLLPLILHFNTEYKPWLPYPELPFREYYWLYYQMSWNEVIAQNIANFTDSSAD